jgi:histidinol-phosphate aminotransferase
MCASSYYFYSNSGVGLSAAIPHRSHGGTDAHGAPRFDFSTNSNACGPCPAVLAALQQADASRYPDPQYTALCAQLAAFHGVAVARIVLAGSASEFIFRMTAWVAQQGPKRAGRTVCVPQHAYGDYAQAAQVWGLGVTHGAATAKLVWCCEPSSPQGGVQSPWPAAVLGATDGSALAAPVVLDCAYAPLRLSGAPSLTPQQMDRVWQLFSPNKALGLTGVRSAYAIAPLDSDAAVAALYGLCPSWPVGAHGVALLGSWVQNDVQSWLAQSRVTLAQWKSRQISLLEGLGWTCLPSETNFFCARPLGNAPAAALAPVLDALRTHGVKLRDATSFGLPGQVRVSVQPPVAQDALARAWAQLKEPKGVAGI